jgi:hypothetical protein
MDAARLRTPYVLLTRLFLRQFLENDLISPDADRTQLLAVVGALSMSLTLFISAFMSAGYLSPLTTPGLASVQSLDDKFFYLSLAMVVTALVAASQWDVLAIDPRDAAILEPLPVEAGTIRRAKVSAIAILGGAVACALNFFPSLVFPWMLVFTFRQMSGLALLGLVVVHALVTVVAAAFGYLVVIALRETLVALLGRRGFTVASPWVQGTLIVLLGSAVLLLPVASDRIGQRGFEGWRAMSPPMWFLGAYEVAVGGVIADQPRTEMRPRQAATDLAMTELYRERRQEFPAMARRAAAAIGVAFLVAVVAYLWNARHVTALAPAPPPSSRRGWPLGGRLADAWLVRDAAARAGFYFTLAAMFRSNNHRLTLVCAAAAGFAMALVAVSNANAQEGAGPSARLLAMQPLLYGALLVGFRHVIRVPAELRANWGFQLAWRERTRAFVAGVKRAAVIGLVLPALAILLPLDMFVMGPQLALMHAGLGLAGAIVLLEALMVSYDKVPFTCTYVPSENMKALAPIYAIAFMVGALNFAHMQNTALQSGNPARVLITLGVAFAILRLMSVKRGRLPQVEFDEAPATYQRLGLYS